MVALVVVLVGYLLPCLSQSVGFQSWKLQHGRAYSSQDEEGYRKQVFHTRLEQIVKHNADPSKPWKMGINKFSDCTSVEFINRYLVAKPPAITIDPSKDNRRNLQTSAPVVDWTSIGKVSPVKDMLRCGASWVFAVTAARESAYLIKNSSTVSLSEQQIMDCTLGGCTIGNIYYSFNISKVTGVSDSSAYTYYGYDRPICYKTGEPIKISNFVTVQNSSCSSINNALLTGPLPIFVDATNWVYYSSGIMNNCGGTKANYYALLVGSTSTEWKLKNSFGKDWGESGFIRLAPGNTCFVCGSPTYQPVV